ncbi:hypothetical protein L195_g058483, partial [Trifolium pratense]
HKPAAVSTSSDRQYDNIIVLEPLTDFVQTVIPTQLDGVISDSDDENTIVVESVQVNVTDPVAKIAGTTKETSCNAVNVAKGTVPKQTDAGNFDTIATHPLIWNNNPAGVDDNVIMQTQAVNQCNDVGVHENTRLENHTWDKGANTILVEPDQQYVPETQVNMTNQSSASNPDTSVDNIFRDTQGRALPLVVQRDIQL